MAQGQLVLGEPIGSHSLLRHHVEVSMLHHHDKRSSNWLLFVIPAEHDWQVGAKTETNDLAPLTISVIGNSTFLDIVVVVSHAGKFLRFTAHEIRQFITDVGQSW